MAPALPARGALPGPRPTPLLGWRGNATAFYRDPLGYVARVYQSYGEIAALVHGDPGFVFALGPSAQRQLIEQPTLFRSTLQLTSSTPPRASTTPLIASQPLDRYGRTVVALTQQVLDRWGIGRLVDVAYVMQHLTMRIAALSLLGLEQPAEVDQAGATVQRWIDSLFARPARMPLRARSALSWHSQQQAGAVQQLIEAALQQHSQLGASSAGAYSLLDALLPLRATNDADTRAAQIEQLARLLVVSTELTTAALSWTLFLLSQHPAILADLGAELHGVLRGAPPTVDDVYAAEQPRGTRLPLLERVICESLRLLPPQSLDLYQTTAAVVLNSYQFPAGATIVASPYLIQRQPEVYFAPHKFRPERWLYIEPSPAEFSPFGSGPGDALCMSLALLELKLILALLLQRYHLALAPGVQIDRAARLTLLPRAGLPMIITHVDRPMIKREAHGTIRDMVALG